VNAASANWVYVALGSNLGDRLAHLKTACTGISNAVGCRSLRLSPIYESAPMGPQDQPDYLNAVCRFHCTLSPISLLQTLKGFERDHGREFDKPRWTARPLDLDIVLFGEQLIDQPELTIPHVGLASRSFVLRPLFDLAPTMVIPQLGPVAALLHNCEDYSIKPYSVETGS